MAGQNDPQSTVAYRVLGARPTPKDLTLVVVEPLPDGAMCWVTSNASVYFWRAYSTAAPLGDDVILPAGRTVAQPGRWHRVTEAVPYTPRYSLRGTLSDLGLSDTISNTSPLQRSIVATSALRGLAAPVIVFDATIGIDLEPNGTPGTNTITISGSVTGPAVPITLPASNYLVDNEHSGTINIALPMPIVSAANNAVDWTVTVDFTAANANAFAVPRYIVKVNVYGLDPGGS